MADLKKLLSEEDWIDLFKARQYDLNVDRQSNSSGNSDSEFDRAWVESREKEKLSNPFLKLDRKDEETEETINCRRKSIAKHIINVKNEALAGLTHQGAKQRFEARAMLSDYYRFDVCLQCPKWLGMANYYRFDVCLQCPKRCLECGPFPKTDARANEILRHLVAEVVRVGEPVPAELRDWVSEALFDDCPKHLGRRKKNWYRNQKITLAVDILVEVTHSSVGNALIIVTDVCQESGIKLKEMESVKTVRDRVIKEARKEEAEAVKR